MPRDGLSILFDLRGPTLGIVCEPCARHGRYNVERLIAAHGADAKLDADCAQPDATDPDLFRAPLDRFAH
jgi:hypothetical protein